MTLKRCPNLTVLKVAGNSISMQRIAAMNAELENNKNLLARKKVPKYLQQINKLKNKSENYDKVMVNIDALSERCSREQVVVDESAKILNKVTELETKKTKKYLADKATVDSKLARLNKEIEEMKAKFEEDKKINGAVVESLKKKSNIMIRRIEDIASESKPQV
eukprot:TRINITY_DN7991_c0_g2_i1.p3 TRINITY_DN7991_c0_g2~~TRINITY_DN7991_c0_g2_i1.p3  ORF type:complete len:164 (+),score=54.12 TRINITY_DN7991_c0_g2_i1:1498-1989(+)